ncbi:MAG: pyrroline-5-carboxylate reductase [Berryella intestinalis]|uniref:pyrroline-5-carboxylate reductase n=1 Tax=Berryella intestinalis TaxID=1531429 RepID=UPI002A4F9335|nr:pyrroline-5-carboxylate reductase [Berryella intestinalis]MDD7368435.1 pyrroline-5-carboxylate reductase [Berryella intestinalis]MDY3128520.1 pyrroline-5-carboxylate reductase [Berryella intestinalis]
MALSHDVRIAIVGAGKMGEALVSGWLDCSEPPAGIIEARNLLAVNRSQERCDQLRCAYGIACTLDLSEALSADIVVIGVKPQVAPRVLADLKRADPTGERMRASVFVSIAAGLSTAAIEGMLFEGARVVRVMPNMPLMVGQGASGVCGGAACAPEDVALVRDLFGCLGTAQIVPESDMDAVCALSGSGPAYVALMVESMRDAAIGEGLDAETAERFALQTVYGTARYMLERRIGPEQTRASICSPNGTTVAALDAMAQAGFSEAVRAAIAAAARRSKELGSVQ